MSLQDGSPASFRNAYTKANAREGDIIEDRSRSVESGSFTGYSQKGGDDGRRGYVDVLSQGCDGRHGSNPCADDGSVRTTAVSGAPLTGSQEFKVQLEVEGSTPGTMIMHHSAVYPCFEVNLITRSLLLWSREGWHGAYDPSDQVHS